MPKEDRAFRASIRGLFVILALTILLGVGAVTVSRHLSLTAGPRDHRPTPAEPSTARSPTQSCRPSGTGVKAPLSGMVTINALPHKPPSFVGGMSLSVAWADLQPTPDSAIVHPNAIDAAIDAVRRTTSTDGCAPGIKLRVLAGVRSPQWAKTLDGPPLQMTLAQDQLSGAVPRFWTARFGLAYASLQRKLAAAYDNVSEIREVAMTRCTTFYGEPLLRQAATSSNAVALSSAGLTDALDRKCLAEQTAAHKRWARTSSSLALNPYLGPASPAGSAGTLDVTLEAAHVCRQELLRRCILANNSLRWPIPPGAYTALYDEMARMGGPLEFQTASPSRVGDLVAAVRWAIHAGAASVETEPASATRSGDALRQLSAASKWGPSG